MILLYTGATKNNEAQTSPDKSLGGFVSSTFVPNGRLNNIFSLISKSTVLNKNTEIRLIVLKNTTGAIVNNVTIHSNTTGSSVRLKLAAVAPFIQGVDKVFESVQDGSTMPYQAVLDYHEGIDNKISVGSIGINEIVGIWILREINPAQFPDLIQNSILTTAQLATLLENTQQKEENISLLINY